MALSRRRPEEIPKDAVIITKEEALVYQWKVLENWENKREIWSLKYGPGILGALSVATGWFVNNHYRSKLRLGNYGQIATYLPIVAAPAMFSLLAHKFMVQPSIILDPLDKCPLCVQSRAAAIQASVGVLYPAILAPISSFMFATRHFTYRLPSIIEAPKEVFQLWHKFTRPIIPVLGTAIAIHGLMAMYITYKEMKQIISLNLKMQEIERDVEEQRAIESIQSSFLI